VKTVKRERFFSTRGPSTFYKTRLMDSLTESQTVTMDSNGVECNMVHGPTFTLHNR
jgi:hypothetical protein